MAFADGCRRSYPLPIEVNLPSLALRTLCGFGRPVLNYSVLIEARRSVDDGVSPKMAR
jgi:hypothetical protein